MNLMGYDPPDWGFSIDASDLAPNELLWRGNGFETYSRECRGVGFADLCFFGRYEAPCWYFDGITLHE